MEEDSDDEPEESHDTSGKDETLDGYQEDDEPEVKNVLFISLFANHDVIDWKEAQKVFRSSHTGDSKRSQRRRMQKDKELIKGIKGSTKLTSHFQVEWKNANPEADTEGIDHFEPRHVIDHRKPGPSEQEQEEQ